jgi:hypothetical protein
MIMMNTWGDRGQDGKINEKFILRELEAGAKLGITHFQIDDGWQQGLSSNSASTAASYGMYGNLKTGSQIKFVFLMVLHLS